MGMKKLVVSSSGVDVELAYIDSGVPSTGKEEEDSEYVTVFMLHGLFFNGAVFGKLVALAPEHNIRIVSINRRGYPGSTPLSETELSAYSSDATEETRKNFLEERGKEILEFIDTFMTNEKLPCISYENPTSQRSKTGGIVLFGWSLGCASVFATLANIDLASKSVQARIGKNLRACILLEPPSLLFNIPAPSNFWIPLYDPQFDVDTQAHLFKYTVTSYYAHSSITSHSTSTLSHVLPSTQHVPSIFNMTPPQQAEIISITDQTKYEIKFLEIWRKWGIEYYNKVCFDREWRKEYFPAMELTIVVGEMGPSAAIMALWGVMQENNKRGGGHVKEKVLKGANHFPHWDDPQMTLDTMKEIIAGN